MGSCVSVEIEEDKGKKGSTGKPSGSTKKPSVSTGKPAGSTGKLAGFTGKSGGSSASSAAPSERLKQGASEHRKASKREDSSRSGGEKSPAKRSEDKEKSTAGATTPRSKSTVSASLRAQALMAGHENGDASAPERHADGNPPAKRMKLKELQAATRNFDDDLVLGEGSFGKVYKGYLEETRGEGSQITVELAVKKLNPQSFQGYDEWLAEVLFLDKLRHPHLVRLVGYCAENGEALLAYELCPKGSLDQVLYSTKTEDVLTWEVRLKVALGTAEGLAYLHENNVIHRDLKPSNILLAKDLTPRLTDFGMAKESPEGLDAHVSTRVMGTLGYLDPAYMQTGRLTRKSDTFSYGVMLLELLSGRRSHDERLLKWARPLLTQRKPDIQQLIDPRLEEDYSKPAATKIAILVKHCVDDDPISRPEMRIIVDSLKKIMKETTTPA